MTIRTSLGESGCAVVALLALVSGLNTGCQTLARMPTPSDAETANLQKGPPSSVEQGRTPLNESFD